MTEYTISKIIRNGDEYSFPGGSGGPKQGYIDILMVGGGGSGQYGEWGNCATHGGGGGGVIECFKYVVTSENSYPVSIGKGSTNCMQDGCSTSFPGLIAYGGQAGRNGGASGYSSCCSNRNAGGSNCGSNGGGGGGGAGTPGCNSLTDGVGGNGGDGHASCISGELKYYGGGGGGKYYKDGGGIGGLGGGGCGRDGNSITGSSPVHATYYGGGGGGGGAYSYGSGYQGVVIIRYKKDGSYKLNMSSGGCRYECGDYYIHCFTNTDFTECFVPVFK